MSGEKLQWKVWINCEETFATTFIEACECIMKYVNQQSGEVMDCFDRVWIEYGNEIISLVVIEQVVREN
jgi:hypothetical protein